MPSKTKSESTKSKKSEKKSLGMIHADAAGIDVGSGEMWVCVPEKRAPKKNIIKFGTFTPDLISIANWLKKCKIKSVAMESTGVYWIPLFEILESRGFEVVLVNARELKNVSGRPKTDRLDCQWIQRLHSYGLLKASFRPEDNICHLRILMRHRKNLVREASKHVMHMQKSLRLMNLVLDKVISDITGETGMNIIKAILRGEYDPYILAKYRDCRIKSAEDDIRKALTGNYRKEEIFVLRQAVDSYNHVNKQILDCDTEIAKHIGKIEEDYKQKKNKQAEDRSIKPKKFRKRKSGAFMGESSTVSGYLQSIIGAELTDLNGINMLGALTLVSETGFDMNKWGSEKRFSSWLGLAPNRKITGGKVLSSSTRKVNSRAAQVFRTAAVSLKNSNCYLGAFYRRIARKSGKGVAVVATARKIAVLYYNTLKYGREFVELGANHYENMYKERMQKNLMLRARTMGYKLVKIDDKQEQKIA